MSFLNILKGLSALVLPTLLAVKAAYPAPGACLGSCWAHDPALFQAADGTYYRFTTGGLIGINIARSIEGPWVTNGSVIRSKSIINLKGNDFLWAPDIQWADGTYYLYYTVSTFGSRDSAIGVATSPSMKEGTWTDLGATGMNFGSFGEGILQVKMSSPTKVSGPPRHIAVNTTSRNNAVEGPFMYKYGEYYYLFWSAGQCCGYDKSKPGQGEEYRIVVCRSSSPRAHFFDNQGNACRRGGGTEVLASHDYVYGPGGQGVYHDRQYGSVLYYHYVDTRIGYRDGDKRFGWNVLDFSSGWPVAR